MSTHVYIACAATCNWEWSYNFLEPGAWFSKADLEPMHKLPKSSIDEARDVVMSDETTLKEV